MTCAPLSCIDLSKFRSMHLIHLYLVLLKVPCWHHIFHNVLDQRVCLSESFVEVVSVLEGLGSNVTRSFDLRVSKSFSVDAIASRPWLAWRGIDEEVNLDPIDLVSNLISTISNVHQLF